MQIADLRKWVINHSQYLIPALVPDVFYILYHAKSKKQKTPGKSGGFGTPHVVIYSHIRTGQQPDKVGQSQCYGANATNGRGFIGLLFLIESGIEGHAAGLEIDLFHKFASLLCAVVAVHAAILPFHR